jgi:hypothetical protein
MAILSKAAFLAKWNALFANNTTRSITEARLREHTLDITDSFPNFTDNPATGESSQATIETQATAEATTYVSPRICRKDNFY